LCTARVEPSVNAFGEKLFASYRLQNLLDDFLTSAITLTRADFGNVQLFDPTTGALRLVAQHGFDRDFLEYFRIVDDAYSACGRTLTTGMQIVIEDVDDDRDFEPHRAIAGASGFRAVQSTPLADRTLSPLGMISTHFTRPHRPRDHELRLTHQLGVLAARVIELKLAEQARQRRRFGRELRIVCEDCREQATGDGSGWVAVQHDPPPHEGGASLLSYCPACAAQFVAGELLARIAA
jgi:GAF domain-containing protein